MKPHLHARTSARKYGGQPEDYHAIHTFIDGSKAAVADVRHRAALHNAFGCFVVEAVFGVTATNSDGRTYSPRDVAEDHIIEDLGFLPSLEHWLRNMRIEPWMSGASRARHMRAGATRAGARDAAECEVRRELREAGTPAIGRAKID